MRWAALLHDVGKPAAFCLDENGQGHFRNHARISAQLAEEILRRMKAPEALLELLRRRTTPQN
jgi:tRNA nucleotidyltransferase (CCA-adding enzyme)